MNVGNSISSIYQEYNQTLDQLSPKFTTFGQVLETNFEGHPENKEGKEGKAFTKKSSEITFSNFPIKEASNEAEDSINNIKRSGLNSIGNSCTESLLAKGNKLMLKGEIFFNKDIIINSLGMINGLRKKKDGVAFLGLTMAKDKNGNFFSDFVLNYPEQDNLKSPTGRVFSISYSAENKDYQLFMIHNNLILYYSISHNFYFEPQKTYNLELGKAILMISTYKNEENIFFIEINVDIMDNKFNYTFKKSEMPVSIGRSNSDVVIRNSSISKEHARIEFSEETQMFYYKDLKSTNGSFVIMKEEDSLRIKGEMKFKLDNSVFDIIEIP